METPFYEEWWFLLVMALSSLIIILLVVFALVLHGQNKKYKNCTTGEGRPPFPQSALAAPELRVYAWFSPPDQPCQHPRFRFICP